MQRMNTLTKILPPQLVLLKAKSIETPLTILKAQTKVVAVHSRNNRLSQWKICIWGVVQLRLRSKGSNLL